MTTTLRVIETREIPTEKDCRHNQDFFFSPYLGNIVCTEEERAGLPGVFKCCLNCNYWLPFDPAKFLGIGYTTRPSERLQNGKERPFLPPLSEGGKH
jgi:hypothetical protein